MEYLQCLYAFAACAAEDAVRITISQGEGENQRVFQVEGLED